MIINMNLLSEKYNFLYETISIFQKFNKIYFLRVKLLALDCFRPLIYLELNSSLFGEKVRFK
jgi:hypothetical protein